MSRNPNQPRRAVVRTALFGTGLLVLSACGIAGWGESATDVHCGTSQTFDDFSGTEELVLTVHGPAPADVAELTVKRHADAVAVAHTAGDHSASPTNGAFTKPKPIGAGPEFTVAAASASWTIDASAGALVIDGTCQP